MLFWNYSKEDVGSNPAITNYFDNIRVNIGSEFNPNWMNNLSIGYWALKITRGSITNFILINKLLFFLKDIQQCLSHFKEPIDKNLSYD